MELFISSKANLFLAQMIAVCLQEFEVEALVEMVFLMSRCLLVLYYIMLNFQIEQKNKQEN